MFKNIAKLEEQNTGFSICFIIKNPLNFPRITFNFQHTFHF